MRAGEMSMTERIVCKIWWESFIDEENDLFCKKNVIELLDSIITFYSLLILTDHILYIHTRVYS